MEKPLFNSALAIRWQLRLYIGANLRKKQVKNFLSDVTNYYKDYGSLVVYESFKNIIEVMLNKSVVGSSASQSQSASGLGNLLNELLIRCLEHEGYFTALVQALDVSRGKQATLLEVLSKSQDSRTLPVQLILTLALYLRKRYERAKDQQYGRVIIKVATQALFKKLEDYFDTNKPLIFKAHIYEPLLQVLNQELMISTNPAKTADIHRYMQYIIETCRPGESQEFVEIFNESKKIISGAGAPQYLSNRYMPPRSLEAPATKILGKIKTISKGSMNAAQAILKDLDDNATNVLPKALYSFGRDLGSKDLDPPTDLQVTELLLFLASRREHIALSEEAYEQMRASGQKKVIGVKMQNGLFIRSPQDSHPLLHAIIASVNEEAAMETMKQTEKQPKVHPFVNLVTQITHALDVKSVNWSSVIEKFDFSHTQRFMGNPLRRPNTNSFHVLPQNYGVEQPMNYPNTAYGFAALIELLSKLSGTQSQLVNQLVTQLFRGVWKNVAIQISLLEGLFDLLYNPQLSESCFQMAINARVKDIHYFVSDITQKVLLGSTCVPEKFIPQFIEYDATRHSNMTHEGESHPQPVPITFSHLAKGEYKLLTSMTLYDLLFKLASGQHQRVKDIFNRWFVRFAKEHLLFSLAYFAIKTRKRHSLLEEMLTDLMRHAFSPIVQTPALFEELWRIHKMLCIKVMSQLYKEKSIVEPDPAQAAEYQLQHLTLSRVLDLTQQEKDALLSIVKCSDYQFAIALGVLAGKREFLHFDEWLNDRINSKAGAPFVLKILQKLESLILNPMNNAIKESHGEFAAMAARTELRQRRDQIIEKSQMSMLSISMLFMNLSTFCHQMGPTTPRAIDRIAIEAIIYSQEALALMMPDIIAPTSQFSSIVGGPIARPVYEQQVEYTDERDESPMSHLSHSSGSSLDTQHSLTNNPTQEIQKEANSVLENTFVGETTPQGLIETMNKLKKSSRKKDREVYACIMHNLLDQYNFFHKYPERELQIMGKIFGLIVKEQLIHDIPMLEKVIRKYIFQTLSRQSGSLFKFGQTALDQMVECLHKWPEYVASILELSTAQNLSEQMRGVMRKIVENHEKRMKDPKPEEPEPDTESPKRQPKATKKGRGASKQGGAKPVTEYVEQSDQHKQLQQVNSMPTIDKEDFRYKSSISTQGQPPTAILKLPPKMGNSLDVKAQAFVPKQQPAMTFGQQGGASLTTTPPPNFMEHITKAMQYSQVGAPPKLTQAVQLTTTSPDFTPSDISALKPLQILTLKRPQLTEVLKERFNAMFNKLTPGNMQNCIDEAYRIAPNVLTAKALALALVTSRATSEPKYQDLYIQFVEKIRTNFNLSETQPNYHNFLANLPDLVLSETTVAIARLLSFLGLLNEKARLEGVDENSFVGPRFDKKILKNLGSFLGKQTVHQHKPILKKQLHLHQILKEAFTEPRLYMTYAVGLLNAIFEFRTNGPTPFSKNNPWILSILRMVNQIGAKYLREKGESSQPVEIQSLFAKFGYSENYQGDQPKPTTLEILSPELLKQLISNDSRFTQITASDKLKKEEIMLPPQIVVAPQKEELLSLGQPRPIRDTPVQPAPTELEQGVTGSRLQRFVSVDPSLRPIEERYKVSLRDLAARAVDKAILEILTPVIERSVTIALITTKKLVLKDFQLQPDKEKLTKAAKDSAKCFAGSLALVTCREPLRVSLQNYLKLELEQQVKDMTREDKEQVINKVSQDNECIKLGCSLIQKTVIERAVSHVEHDEVIREAIIVREKYQAVKEKKSFHQFLTEEMERRIKHMHPTPNQVFNAVHSEQLSVPTSSEGLTANQMIIYEEFSKTIEDNPSRPVKEIVDPINQSFLRMVDAIRNGGQSIRQNDLSSNLAAAQEIKKIQSHVSKLKKERNGNFQQQMAMLEKELENWWKESLYKTINFDSEEAELLGLAELMSALSAMEFAKSVRKTMAQWLFKIQKHCFTLMSHSQTQETRSHLLRNFIEVTALMMKKRLVSLEQWDEANAHELESLFERRKASVGREEHKLAQQDEELNFLLNYINQLCALLVSPREDAANSERPLQRGDLTKLTQFIQKQLRDNVLLSGPPSPHPLQNVAVQQLYRNLTGQEGDLENDWTKIPHNKFRQKIQEVLHNLMIYYVQNRRKDSINQIVQYQKVVCCKFGLTKAPELNKEAVNHFIRAALSVVLRRCHYDGENTQTLEYPPDRLDYRFADLFMVFMYEYIFSEFHFNSLDPELEEIDRVNSQKELIRMMLDHFKDSIYESHTKDGLHFNPRPYYRMLLFFINTTNSNGNAMFVAPFAEFLHSVNPMALPGFAVTWVELFSNGSYMPRLFKLHLSHLAQLVRDLLDLLTDLMPEAEKQWSPAFENYLFATLRILDILRRECPDVLVKYHFDILHSAPEGAIQIRNIILSAVPSSMKHLPSPTDPNLSVEQIPGAKEVPEVLSSFESILEGGRMSSGSHTSLKAQVDYFMRSDISDGEREQTVVQMANKIYMIKTSDQGKPEKVIHALVLMIMKKAAQENKFGKQGLATRLLEDLSMKLSMEELQLLVNAVINELRFVSKYMWLASYIILQLINSPQEQHQKLIAIALLRRIGVKPPHPWGLQVTMREILEHDKKYNFFEKPFIKNDKKVFQRFKHLLAALTTPQ